MDRTKTGALIAAARKEQNMTQKELAAALHVSDRAVSKWERGAGFPRGDLRELAVEGGGFHRSYFLVRHRSKYLTDGMKRVIRVLREHLGGEQP